MDPKLVERLRREMAYEGARETPPDGFPSLPPIPGGRYTDPDFYALERERVWGRSWLLAGREEDLPTPGSYLRFDRLAPILLVRGRDGAVRAFYNTCQHRGAPVVRERCGRAQQLRCQYHSWTYDLEGKLVAVPDRRDFPALDLAERGLQTVRCETWDGWIFVNEDPEAPSLREWLGPLPDELAMFQGEKLRTVTSGVTRHPCNWKVVSDAFLEVYHLRTIHPQTVSKLLDHRGGAMGLLRNGHSRMITPKWEDALTRAAESARTMPPGAMPDIPTVNELVRETNLAYHVFPNVTIPLDAFGFPFLLFWPVDARTTDLELVWYGPDWGDGDRPAFWDMMLPGFEAVMDEDTRNLAPMQQSLESRGLRSLPLSYQERRIYHAHEQVDRMIGAERIPEALRVEPILDGYVER